MKSKKVIIGMLSFGLLTAGVVGADEFSDFRKQVKEQYKQQEDEFGQYKTNLDDEYEKYQKELKAAFSAYQAKATMVWGSKDAAIPDKKRWVEYSNDMKQRSIIDFERGVIKVELVLDEKEDSEQAKKRLAGLLVKTLTSPPDERSIIDIAKHPGRPVSQQSSKAPAMLDDQVAFANGRSVTGKTVSDFSNGTAAEAVLSHTRGDDGVGRAVISAEVALVPDHVRRRAERYKSYVSHFAEEHDLSQELVYAVIETESFFNPSARSQVPAFGLMQLVPNSGARDAYKFLYKKDRVVSETYLYDPKNNIELGAAYLRKLYFTYMNDVSDPQSRLWCAIAAYNTGPGNVYRTFAGKYSKSRYASRTAWKAVAMNKINGMSSEQVFQFLKKNLPYKETQNYIVKVRERMPKYRML